MRRRNLRNFILIAIVAVIADQLTKLLAAYYLTAQGGGSLLQFATRYFTLWHHLPFSPGRPISVWEPWIRFSYASNTGMAWGLLNEHTTVLSLISLFLSVIICIVWSRYAQRNLLLTIALGLVLGGALGNFVDRFRLKEVVDFIDVLIPLVRYDFPVFNLADSCASVGTMLIAGYLVAMDMRASRRQKLLAFDHTTYLP
jgi:signal peptidase II